MPCLRSPFSCNSSCCNFILAIAGCLSAGTSNRQPWYQYGVVPKETCREPKAIEELVNDKGWPCHLGGSIGVAGVLGRNGPLVQTLLAYHPLTNPDHPKGKVCSSGTKVKYVAKAKDHCLSEALKKKHKIDTTAFACCIYNSFRDQSVNSLNRKPRGVAVFPVNIVAEQEGRPEAYGMAAAQGKFVSEIVELPFIADLNAHPPCLHLIVALPITG